jgi:hypothetical protein
VAELCLQCIAIDDGDIGTSLHRQGFPNLSAKAGDIRVWSRRSENYLPNRRRSAGKKHSLYQTSDLLPRKFFGIPNVRNAGHPRNRS